MKIEVEDPKDVQFYSAHARELKRTQQEKILKFIEHRCIEYSPEMKCFLCHPIPGYNVTTYTVKREGKGFSCNCQGYQTKLKRGEEASCSHIGATFEFLKRAHLSLVQEKIQSALTMFG